MPVELNTEPNCYHFDYLKALQRETHRIGLNGEPTQEISAKHKEDAEKYIKTPKNTQFNESDKVRVWLLT